MLYFRHVFKRVREGGVGYWGSGGRAGGEPKRARTRVSVWRDQDRRRREGVKEKRVAPFMTDYGS